MEDLRGKYVIVRGDRSGVFAGILKDRVGREVELTECRRLWYWEGACSISEIAVNGVSKPNECKFTVVVDEIQIIDTIEVLLTTEKAEKNIKGVRVWKSQDVK